MDWNKEITIELPFVIPELAATVLVLVAVSLTALAALLLKKRIRRDSNNPGMFG